ncbi:MAG TPA: FtsX-like permease family protein, partial [Gemmatimonadaceae bacterium]|nr:FtsX-like permease family protein [Gemmatimonadaceae bacterium]
LKAIGRLRERVSMALAQSELDTEAARLAEAYPESNAGQGGRIVPLAEDLMRPMRPALLMVQAGALLLLLIACANIANLLLARAAASRREFAVRIALGASRARLMRQVAVECALLAVIGGGLGLLLTTVGADAVARAGTGVLPDIVNLEPDLRVVTFVIGATFTSALVLAFGPVFWAGALAAGSARNGDALLVALRGGGRGTTPAHSGLRRALVTAQVGLALVALVDGGLLVGSYRRLQAVPPGFDARGVLTAQVALPDARYPRGQKQIAFFRALTNRMARLPGVTATGAVSILPESPNFDQTHFRVVGRAYGPGETPGADLYRVTPGYFAALDIPLLSGRGLTADDDDRHPPVAVINATMARRLFQDSSAVGRRIWSGAGNRERTIVGVVGDVYQYGLDSKRTMQLYVPHADNSGGQLTVAIRTSGDREALALVPALRAAVRALDPDVPLDDVMTLAQVVAGSAARRQFLARVSLGLAAGALLLAAIGLYGVMAYATVQRTGEFGIRMALGASSREIAGLVARDGVALTLRGLLVGLVLARLTAPYITTLLFGVTSTDTTTYLASPVILLCVAVLSCVLPALRAAAANPLMALRGE